MAFSPKQVQISGIVKTKVAGENDLVILSGYAIFDFIHPGDKPGNHWAGEDILIDLPERWISVQSVAPSVSLASITNLQTAVDAGWAVDSARWEPSNEPGGFLEPFGIRLRCFLAVRDVDGIIHRVAFHVAILGKLAE